ncbi:hypothetical protein J8273_8573 [Carpediemonas membranifera]|uniref:Uncharacterized protein n=1 Tax=Carpediemonas membranifera TaxID=201153 RepID=A0A8J6DXC8_9EUKA|nr:hypothetical protein J8273_8573 [Carpediemonas membranifera]|eukprot:KAG9389889.1 hypothetical protein J8273_8573 [Carpediemonas membranifera]
MLDEAREALGSLQADLIRIEPLLRPVSSDTAPERQPSSGPVLAPPPPRTTGGKCAFHLTAHPTKDCNIVKQLRVDPSKLKNKQLTDHYRVCDKQGKTVMPEVKKEAERRNLALPGIARNREARDADKPMSYVPGVATEPLLDSLPDTPTNRYRAVMRTQRNGSPLVVSLDTGAEQYPILMRPDAAAYLSLEVKPASGPVNGWRDVHGEYVGTAQLTPIISEPYFDIPVRASTELTAYIVNDLPVAVLYGTVVKGALLYMATPIVSSRDGH